jgi:hypothetical protein
MWPCPIKTKNDDDAMWEGDVARLNSLNILFPYIIVMLNQNVGFTCMTRISINREMYYIIYINEHNCQRTFDT